MNFLDPYDITRSATPIPNRLEQPTLNEEVNQVIGQLGRFWGGFRAQSQTALSAARKDFGEVVGQAQKELSKLSVVSEPPKGKEPEGVEEETPPLPATASSSSTTGEPSASTSEVPAERDIPPSPIASSSTQGLFSRFQSALPPNVVSTVRDHLPETLKHASENIDLNQLGTNLLSEFQRVQGVTRAQAEEYVHKSEILLRDAVKEAGEVLRDAVKVVPPDEASTSQPAGSGFVWDGSDMWMIPTDSGIGSSGGAVDKGTEMSGSATRGKEAHTAVATRAEALLKRLKHDPSILRHDPEAEDSIKDEYNRWRASEVDENGGIESSEWSYKRTAALEEPIDGPALKELHETLVPSELIESTFWLRFFFRSHQIRAEEEKRKALIHSSNDNDEDFTWEDDEEDSAGPGTKELEPEADISSNASISGKTLKGVLIPSSSGLTTGGTATPRVSSEDSFDMVSSANISVAGDEKEKAKDVDDGGDSDWE